MAQAKIGRGVQITFLGHSAFKLTGAGVNVLIDPWLRTPCSTRRWIKWGRWTSSW